MTVITGHDGRCVETFCESCLAGIMKLVSLVGLSSRHSIEVDE